MVLPLLSLLWYAWLSSSLKLVLEQLQSSPLSILHKTSIPKSYSGIHFGDISAVCWETLSGGLSPFTFWISILLSPFEISWDSLLHSLTIAFSWNATWGMNTNILFEAAVLVFVLPPGTKFRNTVYDGNWTEWSALWAEVIRLISKSNERPAQVNFIFPLRVCVDEGFYWFLKAEFILNFHGRVFESYRWLSDHCVGPQRGRCGL